MTERGKTMYENMWNDLFTLGSKPPSLSKFEYKYIGNRKPKPLWNALIEEKKKREAAPF